MSDLFGGEWREVVRLRAWGEAKFRHRKLAGGRNEVEMLAPDGETWLDVRHPETIAEITRIAGGE